MAVSLIAILIRRIVYWLRAAAIFLLWPILWLYRLRYRYLPAIHFRPLEGAEPGALEGYCNSHYFTPGQTATFYLKAESDNNKLIIERFLAPGNYEEVLTRTFNRIQQQKPVDAAQNGCDWKPGLEITIGQEFEQGYYRTALRNASGVMESYIFFLVGPAPPSSSVAVIAPVCTWMAYNPYGGKSLYHNEVDQSPVYFASANRPNTALQFKQTENMHSWEIEAHVYSWFRKEYGADIYPDYQLENESVLSAYKVLVLDYHCEYVSQKMYSGLRDLLYRQKKSLVALGGNQIYWQIRFYPEENKIECRKDATAFSDNSGNGSTWDKTIYPEEEVLGCKFTDSGMGTFAPYLVTDAEHWLYTGCDVKTGNIFGKTGITPVPICGDETDKSSILSRITTQVIARGLNKGENKSDTGLYDIYSTEKPEWDGSGGGEIAFTPLSGKNAVLHTGSIQSGAGLGADAVFTKIVSNFMKRYLSGLPD